MNYLTESRRHALAAEYVLGTMRGKARLRFRKLMMQSQLLTETTWLWEQHLNSLGETIPPVAPEQSVWQEISRQLGFDVSDNSPAPVFAGPTNRRWKTLASLAMAASILFAVLWVSSFTPSPAPVTHFAVMSNAENNPLWLIEVSDTQLLVRSTDKLEVSDDYDYELWMVPANGEAPVSLGVLPEKGNWKTATPAILRSENIAALAVSQEPPGGSPSGAPTTVLYTASLASV